MNAETLNISDNLRGCINSISPSESKKFFDSMRMQEYEKIRTPNFAEEKELTTMRARVMIIDELENLFMGLRKTT